MKPYREHLQSILSFGETVAPTRKPIFRSSAIFPVINTSTFSTQILFMGYWLRKRSIPEVSILVSLRNEQGEVIIRKTLVIDKVKAFRIMVEDLLAELNLTKVDFIGSLELEVFSTRDMVFPYPAFVVNYFSEFGNTSVHTTGRVYNDIEDMSGNIKYKVPESGFDIYSGEGNSPFISFVNGPFDNSNKPIHFEIIDEFQNSHSGKINISSLKPYQTCFLYLKNHIDLDKILNGKKGTIKLSLDYEGFFTRVIAGNFKSDKAVSITHSFYDSSTVKDENAYQDNDNPNLHDSYVFIPLYLTDSLYTHLVYYPIYSPSAYTMSLMFFDIKGRKLKVLENWKHFDIESNAFFTLDIKSLIKEHLPDDIEMVKGLMIVNDWGNKGIPTRIKYGLNVGIEGASFDLPTNICFAPITANPKLLGKKGTFKWAPVLNSSESEVVITNCGPLKDYDKSANLVIEYYREIDDTVLTENCQLLPFEQSVINMTKTEKLKEFFSGTTGWIAITSDNPFVNAWYFDFDHNSGVVAGDHSF